MVMFSNARSRSPETSSKDKCEILLIKEREISS
jgi:hypothetical protein